MHYIRIKVVILIGCLMVLFPMPGWSQAVFGLSSAPVIAVKSGQTELLGSVLTIVNSGTTVADTLQINISPAVIVNPNGITLTGLGGLAGASLVSVAADAGVIVISIPAGAVAGASLTISGIRASIPALNGLTTLDARISLNSSNTIGAQEASARVLAGVTDGIVVDSTSDTSFIVSPGALIDPLEEFKFREATPDAFSSAVGTLGQTQATQVIFQLVGLPDDVSVSFPSTITGSSGATLTALNNDPITNLTTTARKVYTFTDSPGGTSVAESFTVTPSAISIVNTRGGGTVFVQVGMGPLGNASNVIPRYAEQFFPPLPGSPIITKSSVFPTAGSDTRIVVSNVSSEPASLSVRARENNGTTIAGADATTVNLLPRQSMALVPREVFPGVNLNSLATVEVESENLRLVGNTLDRTDGTAYVLPFVDEAHDLYLPFDRNTTFDVPILRVLNTGAGPAELTLSLKSSSGEVLRTAVRSVPKSGLLQESLTTLFSVQAGGFGFNGYLLISPTRAIRASLVNHPNTEPDTVFGVIPVGQPGMPIPFYAFGGSYNTTLSLINGSASNRAHFTLTPYQVSGVMLAGASPFSGDINPGERLDLDLGRIFGSSSSAVSLGYLRLVLDPINPGPFSGPPPVAGLVRVSAASASTSFPVVFNPASELFLGPTVESGTEYTGISILNAGATPTLVTVEFTEPNGTTRSTTFSLAGGTMQSRLLRELFPGSSHQDGIVRIASPRAVFAVGFRGALTQSDLVYLHAQTAQ